MLYNSFVWRRFELSFRASTRNQYCIVASIHPSKTHLISQMESYLTFCKNLSGKDIVFFYHLSTPEMIPGRTRCNITMEIDVRREASSLSQVRFNPGY